MPNLLEAAVYAKYVTYDNSPVLDNHIPVLSKNLEDFYKNLYDYKETIEEAVNDVIKISLRVAWNCYDKVTKIINNNPENINKLMYNSDMCDSVNASNIRKASDLFEYMFLNNGYKSPVIRNIACKIDPENTSSIIEDLNRHFETEGLNHKKSGLINFYIKENTNLVSDHHLQGNSIGFNITPYITRLSQTTTGPVSTEANIIEFKFNLGFDFDSFVNYFLIHAIHNDNPDEIETMEDFIANNMKEYNRFVYDLSKRITVEVLDSYRNINGYFDKFNFKASKLCESMLKSDLYQDVVGKIRYLLRYNLKRDNDVSRDASFNKNFNINDDRMLLANIFDNIEDNHYVESNDQESLLEFKFIPNTSHYGSDNLELQLNQIVSRAYMYTFSRFFRNEILVEYSYSSDYILEQTRVAYYKEFDKKYDLGELFIQTDSISDYNLKDYFQETLRNFKKNSYFHTYKSRINANGEKFTFLNSKSDKFLGVYVFGVCVLLRKIMKFISMLEERKTLFNEEFDGRLKANLRDIIIDRIQILGKMLSDSVYPYPAISRMNHTAYQRMGFNKFAFMLHIRTNHMSEYNIEECNANYNDNIEKLLKMISKEDEANKCECILCEKYKTLRKSNFRKAINDFIDNYVIYPL